MGRAFGFIALIIVVAVGAYLYMRQAQSTMTAGTTNPTATVDIAGVKNDLLAMAQAERVHNASRGSYASLDELRAQGDLVATRANRGPYSYSAEISETGFRIVATYSGPANSGMPKTLTIDDSMQISQQFGNQ